jgi:hypothetical protein
VNGPHAEIRDEGKRVAEAAASQSLALRLAGGVAVAMRCPSSQSAPLYRAYADIDAAGSSRDRNVIVALLKELGYEPDEQFNALHGARRLFFWDSTNGRQLDVFLDRVVMCHELNLAPRLGIGGATLPLADLLLMKLQVVETNAKDLTDILTLLVDHPFSSDESGINLTYLCDLTAEDWGLWKTTTMVIEKADAHARRLDGFDRRNEVHAKVRRYLQAVEDSPKSRTWKLRAKIGERKRWYQLPEEAH